MNTITITITITTLVRFIFYYNLYIDLQVSSRLFVNPQFTIEILFNTHEIRKYILSIYSKTSL